MILIKPFSLKIKPILVAQTVKNPPAMWETWVWSLGWEEPLKKGTANHYSILAREFHEQRSLAGYNPWGHKESDTTEWLTLSLSGIITLKFIRASEEYMKQYTNLAHHHFYQSLVKYMNLRTTVVKFSSLLLQQSTAVAPYLGQGVSPHGCASWPWTE